jgi:hypothetical protein
MRRLLRDPEPITYRMLHEDVAGVGLSEEFFTLNHINPDGPVLCNCAFDEGHEPTCDIVAANALWRRRNGMDEGDAK